MTLNSDKLFQDPDPKSSKFLYTLKGGKLKTNDVLEGLTDSDKLFVNVLSHFATVFSPQLLSDRLPPEGIPHKTESCFGYFN